MGEYLLRTINLTKQYKKQKAVDNISIHIERGAIYGLIGRNGAGKTTFMKMVSRLAAPTSGRIELFGYQRKAIDTIYDRIGMLIEEPGLYPNYNGYDNLKLKAICMGVYKKEHIDDILETVGLSSTGNKKVKNFSLGMKQRLGIGMALVGEPDLLVLDEPINGLDPQGIAEVRDIILRLNQERNITVIISSHILEELSKLATHYGVIHQGKLLAEFSKKEIMQKCQERIELIVEKPDLACTILEGMDIHNYKVVDEKTICVYEKLEDMGNINMELTVKGIKVNSINVVKESLEKYFMELTGGYTGRNENA